MYSADTLSLYDLTVEHLANPLGIDCARPRFAWKLRSERAATDQASYQVRVFSLGFLGTGDRTLVADTGVVASSQSIEVEVPGFTPEPQTAYAFAVTVTDNHGRGAEASGSFETGLMGGGFKSGWVEPEQEPTPESMPAKAEGADGGQNAEPVNDNSAVTGATASPSPAARDWSAFKPAQYIRIPFTVAKPVTAVRVYATAHGIYDLTVNGTRPDDRVLAPEHTPYGAIQLYQTYDVTALIAPGENALGVVLADGWWTGRVGTTGDSCQYGTTLGLLLDIELVFADGTRGRASAEQGVSHEGPVRRADLFVGEAYDARRELVGWDRPGFDAAGWLPVRRVEPAPGALIGQDFEPVRSFAPFSPARVFTAPNGDVVVDAGQVVAGVVEISLSAPEGVTITLEHGEVLDADGNFFNNILNDNKDQTDVYTARAGRQTWRPRFTYHGFRYVRVTGWPGTPTVDDFRIVPYASAMADLGSFATSDERLNQLASNIRWSQIGNTVSIPTDCPSREKAGWTGDVAVYAPTMCFVRDAHAFLRSWLRSLRAEQLPSGAVPMIVPYLKAYRTFLKEQLGSDTSSGWGDAVILAPLALWRAYGDVRALEENYPAMQAWLAYIEERARTQHPAGYEGWSAAERERDRYLWNTDFHFGDWLIPSIVLGNPDAYAMNLTAERTMGVVGPAFYAFTAGKLAEVAGILGCAEDAARYAELAGKVRAAFASAYVGADGRIEPEYQGIYVIALALGLVPEDRAPAAVARLVELIEQNGWRLDTGFLSVPFLLDVLCDHGRADVAYRLLFQDRCPSWLYEVDRGATTLWESWGAIAEDGTPSTYSYNHYAFGCVGNWLYRRIGGLVAVESGYRRFRVEPALDCGLERARVAEETPYGRAAVAWEIVPAGEKDEVAGVDDNGDGGGAADPAQAGEKNAAGRADCMAFVQVDVPPNTRAEVHLPGIPEQELTSGHHAFLVPLGQ